MADRNRLDSLTGLRYVAAVGVVFFHSAEFFGKGTWVDVISKHGYVGIAFFFLLSGFILAWTRDERLSKRDFYRRRFARIYPMYIAAFLLAVVAAALVGTAPSMAGLVLGLLLLQAWVRDSAIYNTGNPVSWSLSCEAFFYALFPFIAPRLSRLRGTIWIWPLVVVVAAIGVIYSLTPAYDEWFAYYNPVIGLIFFVLGIILAHGLRENLWAPGLMTTFVALNVVYVLLSLLIPDVERGVGTFGMTPLFALLIIAAARHDAAGKKSWLGSGIMTRFGEWSYSVYLLHYTLFRAVVRILGDPLDLNGFWTFVVTTAFLALCTAAAGVAYTCWERPMERRLRGSRIPRPAS